MAELMRLEINVAEEFEDALSGVLALLSPQGWEEQTLPTGGTLFVVHSGHFGFCQEIRITVEQLFPGAAVRSFQVEEENWVEAWKEFFTPVEGGTHFLVLAPWMEDEKKATKRTPIIIEPKMAFGTGHHASTALCLEAISTLFMNKEIVPQMRFLDLGTGSGILGIACAKLGLVGEAVDIDPVAIYNAVENRDINNVSTQDLVLSCGGLELATGVYQLIVANILAGPLQEMAPALVEHLAGRGRKKTDAPSHMANKGILVLSGILATQAAEVEASYLAVGMPKPRILTRNEWVALIFAD